MNIELDATQIPEELRQLDQWVLWKEEDRPGSQKLSKVPYNKTGRRASVTNTEEYLPFEEALALWQDKPHQFSGIGFVFTEKDPYLGIDIDSCMEDGELDPDVRAQLEALDSYTETSVSGTGIHTIMRGRLPGERNRTGSYEFYEKSRYFVFTGKPVAGFSTKITERQEKLKAMYQRIFGQETAPEKPAPLAVTIAAEEEDQKVLDRLYKAKSGEKFRLLFVDGDTEDYGSPSEADLALCSLMAYQTFSVEQIDRLFRMSALHREKWERKDYRDRTIRKALEGKNPSVSSLTAASEKWLPGSVADYLSDPRGFIHFMNTRGEHPPLRTGITGLDSTLGGGLYPGLYILGAGSGVGKTALCSQMADDLIRSNDRCNVLFFCLEMSQNEMLGRALAREGYRKDYSRYAAMSTGNILNGRTQQHSVMELVGSYQNEVGGRLRFVQGNLSMGIDWIRKTIEHATDQLDDRLVIFIDYLQIIPDRKDTIAERQGVDRNIVTLKQLATVYDIPIVVTSSLNRSGYNREVAFESFKESGAIEYTADVVLGLQNPGVEDQAQPPQEDPITGSRQVCLSVLKNRRGKSGVHLSLAYVPSHNVFLSPEVRG